MKIYYSNEPSGMVAIIGKAGEEAHTVDSMGYKATEEALQAELADIADEFGITEPPVPFATADELTAFYDAPEGR